MRASRPHHLLGHSTSYSKTLIPLKSIGRVILEVQGQKHNEIATIQPFSKICSIKTTLCENKLTSPPCRTLNRLLKNTNSTQIHWSGDPRGQGQRYKRIINMYPFSKISCIKTSHVRASRPHHLAGHSTSYSKTLTLLKSIVRVTLEVKVKSTIKLQLYSHFQKFAL